MAGILQIVVNDLEEAAAAVRAVYGWGVTECGGQFYLDDENAWFQPVAFAVVQPTEATNE